ncbi:CHASE domain-containing protein [Azospirillum sp. ST 5-10]|uniref:CHASE domain-containing protein n=1 Tax=unclassified Azospirillum TaxID=2630922 RepID=UPI003F4A6307
MAGRRGGRDDGARPGGRWPWLRSRETAAVLGLSLLLTALAAWLLNQQVERLADARFRARAKDLAVSVVRRLDNYQQILRSGVAFMQSSVRVERDEWRTFVAGLRVEENYPGIQGIGFAAHVPSAGIAAHEAAVRGGGLPDYRVWPESMRDEHFPILFLEPFDWRNQRALGYDMFSEPARHAAMTAARDEGRPAATGKVTLVQETDKDIQAGFLLYLPLYRQDRPRRTVEERRAAIDGFVYSPFRMRDLMREVLSTGSQGTALDVQIYDGPAPSPDRLLYGDPDRPAGTYAMETVIDVFGRPWLLDVRSTPAFDGTIDRTAPAVMLMAGLMISLLLMAVTRSLLVERERAAALEASYAAAARARAEAEHADAAKTRFLAAASHDLRQPLQTLGIYLHLVAEHAGKETQGPMLTGAHDAFDIVQRQLNAIMDIAALESGTAHPQAAPVRLDALLERLAGEARAEAERKGLDLRVRTCPAEIRSDPEMLGRIVANLLHNALKYTTEGTVLLACRHAGDDVAIKVQDTGPGIPADRKRLIFEDFYQVGNPERDRSKGLGLGLATVARLARLLGCRIDVLSRPGRGAVFTVRVPGRQAPPV